MARFSVGEATGAGFRLIRRRPLAPLIWGLIYGTVAFAPFFLLIALTHNTVGEENAPADFERMWATMLPIFALQPVIFIASVVGQAVLYSAVFRAVLEPDDDRWFYLRFGMQELWVGLVQFCVGILIMIPGFTVVCLFIFVGAIAYFGSGGGEAAVPAMIVVATLGVISFLGVVFWFYARLALAAPMSFQDRTFRLFESWTLTRGSTGRLLLLGLLIFLIVMAVYVVAIVALTLAGIAGLFGFAAGGALPSEETSAAAAVAIAAAAMAVASLLIGYVWAIAIAPWADAFRQLRGATSAPAAAPAP